MNDPMTAPSADPFEARLQAMFAEVAPPAVDEAFIARLEGRLTLSRRLRFWGLSAAALAGAALAGSQLGALADLSLPRLEMAGGLDPSLAVQAGIALAIAGAAALFARFAAASD